MVEVGARRSALRRVHVSFPVNAHGASHPRVSSRQARNVLQTFHGEQGLVDGFASQARQLRLRSAHLLPQVREVIASNRVLFFVGRRLQVVPVQAVEANFCQAHRLHRGLAIGASQRVVLRRRKTLKEERWDNK